MLSGSTGKLSMQGLSHSAASKRVCVAKVSLPSAAAKVQQQGRSHNSAISALPDTVQVGVDTVSAELILRAAAHTVRASGDAHGVSSLFHSLNHAIGGRHLFDPPSSLNDGLAAISDLPAQAQHLSVYQESMPINHMATLPMDPLQLDPDVASAANQVLQKLTYNVAAIGAVIAADTSLDEALGKLANNAAATGAAISTGTSLDEALGALGLQELVNNAAAIGAAIAAEASMNEALGVLGGLTDWASKRLSVVQAIDPESYNSLNQSLSSVINGLKATIEADTTSMAEQYTNALVLGVQQLVTGLSFSDEGAGVTVESIVAGQEAMAESAKDGGFDKGFLVQVSMAAVAAIVASIPKEGWEKRQSSANPKPVDDEVIPLRYDPQGLAKYFSRRPVAVLQRNAEVIKYFVAFVGSLNIDARTGMWEKNMPARARWLRLIAEDLGPTYIKFVQAASTRVDMVPEVYITEFSKLQDNVPTFSTMDARTVLEEGLGCPVDQVFDWISEEPLAAASLGQVYKAKLRDDRGGKEVAIKVQRPGVLESASLDIYVMRQACLLFSKLPGMSAQWACALDDWAERFFQEMDYQLEAFNTMTFQRDMASLEGVMVATVFPELTSRKVLCTEWIVAERLASTSTEDVQGMCSTLLNCYLIQLLETGLLHADPHPGNLMLTPDGKIVILDFGLVREDQRIALVEFITHLMLENWVAVAEDLVRLGFMPEGLPEGIDAKQLAPFLQGVMGQLVKGGGIRGGINIMGMTAELEGVARNYKLSIPPYFALVLRAFAVIEGIALNANPDYAIIHQCLPYLSRRLLTDNNPRMRAALRQMLYGESTRLDIDRLQRLVGAFSSFSTGTSCQESITAGPTFSAASDAARVALERGGQGAGPRPDEPIINEAVREALKVIFAVDGSYAQELIVEELVAATDAMSREALSEGLVMVMSSATMVSSLRSVEALGPLRAVIMPFPVPLEIISSMQPVMALTQEDRQALHTLRSSANNMPGAMETGSRALRAAGEVMPMLPELLPGVRVTLELFMRQLVRRMALRLAEDLEPGRMSAARA
eukprot:gene30592-35603_t